MAVLKIDSFPKDEEGKELLRKVRRALTRITGHGHGNDGTYLSTPKGLNAERDMLHANYKEIWRETTIDFDPSEKGASANVKTRTIKVGEFFLRSSITVMDMQKVILHEFLHIALENQMREFHHGQIEQIVKYNLGYPGDANPFCPG